ncbi:ribosomal L28 family protein [Colletotrichum camelliae]|nr:ribosomal L28 family protein [Colletotrichum camelliae]
MRGLSLLRLGLTTSIPIRTPAALLTPPTLRHSSSSSTPPTLTETIPVIPIKNLPSDALPPYPYGPRLIYKQSNNGLYGSARIRVGHNVAPKHHQVSPRKWRPNVHRRRLWSDALGAWVRTRLTIRVLRTIRKEGGLDAYVTKTKTARVKELGPSGWKLRWMIVNSAAWRESVGGPERERLGVTQDTLTTSDGAPVPDYSALIPIRNWAAIHAGRFGEDPNKLYHGRMEHIGREEELRMLEADGFALGEEAQEEKALDEAYEEVHIEGQEAGPSDKTI